MNLDIIAEIGQAHDGSLGIAHSYIDAIANTGVNAIKFQVHIASAESSIYEPFRVNFSYQDHTRFDYWKRMEFTEDQWIGLKKHCNDVNLEFLATPFSVEAVELLERIGVERYKIGSGDIHNYLLTDRIAKTQKPIILSSGMSSISELDDTISRLKKKKCDISLLQCTTSYPTRPKQWGLNVISELKERFSIPIGFSDHSGDIYACLFAAAMGAEIFEFHVVFDQVMFGPDSKSSLNLNQIKRLVSGLEQFKESTLNPVDKSLDTQFNESKVIFGRSLALRENVKKNDEVTLNLLESKKPYGKGIDVREYQSLIGSVFNKDLPKGSFVTKDDILK